jgi:hypothetical protein
MFDHEIVMDSLRKISMPLNFTQLTLGSILPKEFALELVRRYKEIIAP